VYLSTTRGANLLFSAENTCGEPAGKKESSFVSSLPLSPLRSVLNIAQLYNKHDKRDSVRCIERRIEL